MSVIVDEAMLREPNLWVPGRKPIGPVKIDFDNPITRGIVSYGLADNNQKIDLATNTNWYYYSNTPDIFYDVDGQYLHFNDTRNAETIILPGVNTKLDGVKGLTLFCRCRFHGTSSTDEDSLIGRWNNLQGTSDNNAIRTLLRYDSNAGEIDMFISDGLDYSTTKSYTFDTNFHDVIGRYDGSNIEIFIDGISIGSTAASNITIQSASTSLEFEVMGGLKATIGGNQDSPRFDLHNWGIWNRGLTNGEIISINNDRYQFLVPA